MKKIIAGIAIFFLVISSLHAQLVAFPGAEGFGKFARGARVSSSPTVYRVTNLNDTGSGSFRDAVSASNRIVVFDVAGVIKITSRIVVSPNVYIAGQTAPGEGITVYGNGFSFSGASNVICRYLRMRMGANGDSGKDACGIANGSNMIFDHVSVAWGRDETFSISGDNPANITIQNSIISQGLLAHSAGGLIQTNGGVTLYRNLYVDNDTRNNKIKGVNQYVNNMVYNWSSGAYIMGGDSEGESYANCESNLFINGPANSGAALGGGNSNYHIYADDNWWDKNRNFVLDPYLVPQSEYSGGPDFQTVRYDYPVVPKWSALQLVDSVLPKVGACLPYRDLLDCYVIDQVKTFGKKGKFISNETENPIGTPSQWLMWAGTKRTDTDNDGMPDAWETANGLNPNLASDAVTIASNGYLNIENYINSITANYSQDFLRAPLNLTTDSVKQNDIYLTWYDFTDKETGYSVEQKINGAFTEISRTTKDVNVLQVSGFVPEQTVVFRVRAFNDGGYSTYSNELTVKTKPIPVAVTEISTFSPDLTWSGSVNMNWDKSTTNWLQSNAATLFTDNAKTLFTTTNTASTVSITEPLVVNTVVVNSASDYTFTGSALSGTGSINKAGEGKLSLVTDNSYTGATVLHGGILEIAKLANGGSVSSIGASQNYDFNFVLKGGKMIYTGASVSTDRSIVVENSPEISVANSAATITLNGLINGTGSIVKSGQGAVLFKGINTYEGATTINEGTIEYNGIDNINASFAADKMYVLNGGKLKTSGGATADYENYYSPIIVADGKVSTFEPFRNCYIKSKVSGNGTLNFNITYVREYLQGDWSEFSGTIYANGVGTTTDGNQFMLNNTNGLPNCRVVTTGNTKIICWKNASTMYLGGLAGPSGSYLAGSDKQNNAATMTWIVGGAGTDEIFAGVINNECSNKSYKGVTSIVKEGTGYWKLTGANIYSGTTTVKDGMLIINGTQTGTGKVTVMDEAILAGKGTVPAQVEVQSGGFLQPGDPGTTSVNNIGTLTVGSLNLMAGSQTKMEIVRSQSYVDKVVATGSVVLGGTLNLAITGTLNAGDQFTLFTGSSISGTFSQIIPATPGAGLQWKLTGGVLSVVNDVNAVNAIQDNDIKIYPNPVKSSAEIIIDKPVNNVVLCVTDVNGREVMNNTKINSGKNVVDFSVLPKNIYFLKIKNDNKVLAESKMIKL